MTHKLICIFKRKKPGLVRSVSRMLIYLFFTLAVCLYPNVTLYPAEEMNPEKHESSGNTTVKVNPVNGKNNAAKNSGTEGKGHDPMSIPDEIERQLANVEPPEVRITGIIEAGRKKAAIAELNLENFKGVVMFEPGMTVSIPKPDRNDSISNRWMTLFTVKDVTGKGVLIVLENGEKIWFPLMGEKK